MGTEQPRRSTSGGGDGGGCCGSCSYHRYYGWMVTLWVCFGVASAQDCGGTDVGVVVVVSVFGTLAVVAVVLGVVLFLLRRRNGGVLFPKRGQGAAAPSGGTAAEEGRVTHDSSYVNQAFSAHDVTEGGEHGRRKSSPQKSQSPGKQTLPTDSQKTWVSLPGEDHVGPGGLHRHGSCGSLDTSVCTGPETVNVSLRSQDIIGLGFNISGNMRDGIYVSQIHSRGPAVESGKMHVGDRILNVTIGYESMVYEDALTILSYASPYPVHLSLSKDRPALAGSTRSRGSRQLHHPLYRSQSLDTLMCLGRGVTYRPKRTHSDVKKETSGKAAEKNRKSQAISQSYSEYGSAYNRRSTGGDPFDVSAEVLMQEAAKLRSQVSAMDSLIGDDSVLDDNNIPGGLNSEEEEGFSSLTALAPSGLQLEVEEPTLTEAGREEEGVEAQAGRKKSRLDMEAAREFAHLMGQVQDAPSKKGWGDEGSRPDPTTTITTTKSTKTVPSKPERKKKPSNASTVSSDDSAEGLADGDGAGAGAEEETFRFRQSAGVEALARSANQPGAEIEGGFVKRDTVTDSDAMELLSLESPASPDRTVSPDRGEVSVHAEPTPSSSRERPKDRESREKKKQSREERKPVLDDEALERLIAMNSFPPGSQGLAGIQAGGRQGGVHDDFVPRDLLLQQSLNNGQAPGTGGAGTRRSSSTSSSSEASSSQNQLRQRGAVAFEVREDVLTGRPLSVDITRGSRNNSASPSRSGSRDRIPRVSSATQGDIHHHSGSRQADKENQEDRLDWSGKRLVRSGSFSLIPQDDSLNADWTDKKFAGGPATTTDDDDDDDENSMASGKPSTAADTTNPDSDCEPDPAPPPRGLTTARDVFRARENLAHMSDLSNSLSSSRSSSPPAPPPPPPALSNGPPPSPSSSANVQGLKNVATTSTTTSDLVVVVPSSSSDTNGNSKTMGVTLQAGVVKGDVDC
ncbi:uncharacterized protein LOC143296014 [Babylonia areolata]|uniref:uncharacterized protein LOC143296014 n=1 Tax=Babylonia areolata TaxID=304850 RepID=UPI003FD236C3